LERKFGLFHRTLYLFPAYRSFFREAGLAGPQLMPNEMMQANLVPQANSVEIVCQARFPPF
jgi:hypothetical protein